VPTAVGDSRNRHVPFNDSVAASDTKSARGARRPEPGATSSTNPATR
jgi:hypothetical protein